MAFDLYQNFWSSNDLEKFNANYEKLFVATTESLDVITWADGDTGFATEDIELN